MYGPWRIHLVDRLFSFKSSHCWSLLRASLYIYDNSTILPKLTRRDDAKVEENWIECDSTQFILWLFHNFLYFSFNNNNKKSLLKPRRVIVFLLTHMDFLFTLMSLLNAGIIHHPTLHSRALFYSTISIIVLIIQFEWQKSFSFPLFTVKASTMRHFWLGSAPIASNGAIERLINERATQKPNKMRATTFKEWKIN